MRDLELEKRATEMLLSSDPEMKNLGIIILTNYFKSYEDYKKYRSDYLLYVSPLRVEYHTRTKLFDSVYAKFSNKK